MTDPTETPPPRPRRAPYANGERRRADIVAAAFRVFAQQGYEHLSLRQLAAGIDTTHTALLHHFGSKDALLEAVMEHRDRDEGPWREAILSEKGLLDGIGDIMEGVVQRRGVIELDTTLQAEAVRPDHTAHESSRTRLEDFRRSVRAELEREQDAGRLRPGLSLDQTAQQIVALVTGLQVYWLYDEDVDIPATVRAYIDLIRR